MTPLAVKALGVKESTGLTQRAVIYKFSVDAKTEVITIFYEIETLSPTGLVIMTSDLKTYSRTNIPAVLDEELNEVTPANPQFNNLRDSALGQSLIGMLQTTLNLYPDVI